jgi:hypothetical protein
MPTTNWENTPPRIPNTIKINVSVRKKKLPIPERLLPKSSEQRFIMSFFPVVAETSDYADDGGSESI